MNTPLIERLHVGIFGKTNSGKSSLFNAIIGSTNSIVSDIAGTTTDVVKKPMELLPFGPIVLIDTAGFSDNTKLGRLRILETEKIINQIDFAIYVAEPKDFDIEDYNNFVDKLNAKKISHIIVYTKTDIAENNCFKRDDSVCTSVLDANSIDELRKVLADELSKIKKDENSISIIESLVPDGGNIVLVISIDSEAPKGRLILPQVQLIRECIDKSISCHVTNEKALSKTLENLKNIDLVVTDSQIFKVVSEIVPDEIPLTSFSILLARQKGNIDKLIKGLEQIKNLKDGDKVLIAEVCSHNVSHEDIGRVKIPNAIKKLTSKNIEFDFYAGHDYPKNLSDYSLIIHCGGCMVTKKEIENRINLADKTPITNYGLVLAYATGILDRSIAILKNKE